GRSGVGQPHDCDLLSGGLREAGPDWTRHHRGGGALQCRALWSASGLDAAGSGRAAAGISRILDGNVLAGSEHRVTPLRQWLNACLPGKSLVIYEPGLGLVTDVVLCEDAYTQERALVTQILPRVRAQDLFIADRNFCTTRFVFGIHAAQ